MKTELIEYLLINREASIIEAMRLIDKNAKGILIVVDQDKKILGTITDGDIRRAILKEIPVTSGIESLYNQNSIFVYENTTTNDIKKMFIDKKIKFVPVVDKDHHILGYYEIDDFINYSIIEKDNPIIIMAGGLGTRLKPLTDNIPKPMLKVGNKPILQTIIEQFRDYGFKNIFISVNYKSELIKNYFRDGKDFDVSITYIEERKRLGTAGAIKLAEKYINKNAIVINGDILTNINFHNLLKYHEENNFFMTIGSREYEMQVPYGVLNVNDAKVLSLEEKPVYSYVVSGGVYIINPDATQYIPQNEFYDITDLINQLVANNKNIGSFPIKDYWMDIGKIEDYYKANDDITKFF